MQWSVAILWMRISEKKGERAKERRGKDAEGEKKEKEKEGRTFFSTNETGTTLHVFMFVPEMLHYLG